MRAWFPIVLLALLAAVAAACLNAAFACDSSDQCVIDGVQGTCVAGGCALPDDECPSQLRWHGSAPGGMGGQCVDKETTSSTTDASTGAASTGLGDSSSEDTGVSDCPGDVCGCATAVEVGYSQSCALRTDGALLCWGDNDSGEVGVGTTSDVVADPTVITLEGADPAVAISAEVITCIRDAAGAVQCWGPNGQGQADPTLTMSPVVAPSTVDLPGMAVAHRAGVHNACAITDQGALWCWGGSDYGELGGGPGAGPGPLQLGSDVGVIDDVAPGQDHTCVLEGGRVHCLGRNDVGQLGVGDSPAQSDTLLQVPLSADARLLSGGRRHTCAVLQGDAVAIECWGHNAVSQTGADASVPTQSSPNGVDTSTLRSPVAMIKGFDDRTCVLTEMGVLHCWGHASNATYRSDKYAFGDPEPVPQPVDGTHPPEETVVDFDHGQNHACVVTDHRRIFCWGDASSGALGPDPPEVDLDCPAS